MAAILRRGAVFAAEIRASNSRRRLAPLRGLRAPFSHLALGPRLELRRLAFPLRRSIARRADRGERPRSELAGILEHFDRHAPIRHRDRSVDDWPERLAPRDFVRGSIAVVDFEEQLVGCDDAEEAVGGI